MTLDTQAGVWVLGNPPDGEEETPGIRSHLYEDGGKVDEKVGRGCGQQ